jgi:hypothetical protein
MNVDMDNHANVDMEDNGNVGTITIRPWAVKKFTLGCSEGELFWEEVESFNVYTSRLPTIFECSALSIRAINIQSRILQCIAIKQGLSTFNPDRAIKFYPHQTRGINIQSLIVTSAHHSQNICPQEHAGDTQQADDSATDSSKLGGACTPFNQPRGIRLQTPTVFSYHISQCQTARWCSISELRVALNGLIQTRSKRSYCPPMKNLILERVSAYNYDSRHRPSNTVGANP